MKKTKSKKSPKKMSKRITRVAVPLSLERFKKKLAAGLYVSIAGANRAIGKSGGMTEDERKKAHAAANKAFGVDKKKAA